MSPRSKEVKKLLTSHNNLIHSEHLKVRSHVQREEQDWFINTLMIQDYDVPFIFKRKQPYKNLKGSIVNLTYYPQEQIVGGISFETMKVVRIRLG